mmetsp:Transcript_29143/g.41017  ORF Transcript_29143/g.41017 Transcript_29143/m.41017 type:complete len:357 (+) Transcript_29143:1856-2926(+)
MDDNVVTRYEPKRNDERYLKRILIELKSNSSDAYFLSDDEISKFQDWKIQQPNERVFYLNDVKSIAAKEGLKSKKPITKAAKCFFRLATDDQQPKRKSRLFFDEFGIVTKQNLQNQEIEQIVFQVLELAKNTQEKNQEASSTIAAPNSNIYSEVQFLLSQLQNNNEPSPQKEFGVYIDHNGQRCTFYLSENESASFLDLGFFVQQNEIFIEPLNTPCHWLKLRKGIDFETPPQVSLWLAKQCEIDLNGASSSIEIVWQGQYLSKWDIQSGETVRFGKTNLQFNSGFVSDEHFQVANRSGLLLVQDISRNGTWIFINQRLKILTNQEGEARYEIYSKEPSYKMTIKVQCDPTQELKE